MSTATLHQQITDALAAVFGNTWAIELPPDPAYPAVVFDVDSEPEPAWCAGGGYMQHDINVVAVARDLDELDALLPLDGGGTLRPALQALPAYQWEEACGDADYEPDPQLYARFLTVRLRTPRY
ncbi:hypothetical protein [Melaminivora sp.]|uniref:hypothetical protein n=1 Tax=Melaminivora sp. TaxID=1933032 RepID=UPI0028AFEABC|nr:hypothetical protein [Melaminivora sp.]